ncbi:MAG: lytic transglycosylase domain-containing protein [Terracidiphilus sp.]
MTLRNGFQMRCDHHAVDNGHVRLYLSASEDDYIELPPAEITVVARVADAPLSRAAAGLPADGAPSRLVNPNGARLSHTDLAEMLADAGREHNLDVDLLASLVNAESSGNPRAVSRAGARGLMQLMPATAAQLGVKDSFQPAQNVSGGSAYLDALLTRYKNNLALALAAYNAGPEAVARYHGIPPYPETRVYVARVIHEFNRRVLAREASQRRPLSSRIEAQAITSR